jgi:peptidoglycan/LPS O-acetylase OafA/YrhL
MDCLALGSLFTLLWRSHKEKMQKYGYLFLIPTFLTPPLMIYLDRYQKGFSTVDGTIRGNVVTLEISLIAAMGVFLWALGGKYTWILTTAPMVFLGRISYSFYLIHLLMLQIGEKFVHNPYAIAAFGFAGSTVYATLSWYLMERPILHGGRAKTRRLEAEAAQHTEPVAESQATV